MSRKQIETGYQKYIYDEEFEQIKVWIDTRLESPYLKMLLRFMMFSGCPPIDAVKMKVSNFNTDCTRAEFIRQKTARYQRIYTAHIPDFLAQELKAYIDKYRECFIDGYIFPANYRNQSQNKHIHTTSIRMAFCRIRKDLGLNDVYYTTHNNMKLHRISPYTLRHYCAQKVYEASGNSLIVTKEYLNHQKTDTTGRYLKGFIGSNHTRSIINKAFEVTKV